MRVVFMGTPEFAVPSLRALASAHEVVVAYTRPDAVSGRGNARLPSPVKETALELGIPVRQPDSLKDPAEQTALSLLAPDVICVAAYGLLLPPAVLGMPRFGALNVHASLLPRWRGAAPVQRAILAGDEITGVSIMLMEEGLDTGPFTHVVEVPTDEFSARELTMQLAQLGASALLGALSELADGTVVWTAQDESRTTYAPKIAKQDVALAPDLSVAEAVRRVRASTSRAPSRLRVGKVGLTVLRAIPASGHPDAGLGTGAAMIEPNRVRIGLSDGAIELVSVRPDGKREMSAAAWARGARLPAETSWSAAQ